MPTCASAAVPPGAASAHPIFVAKALGAEVWDVEGRHYIDFASGIGVNNVGNLHPEVVAAIQSQLGRFAHTAFAVAAYEEYLEVCEALNRLAPIRRPRSVLFTTGAEATENAVKVARLATGREAVVAFTGAFHGRTHLAAAMTGKVAPLRLGVVPNQSGVFHVPVPTPHHGVNEAASLQALEHLFRATIAPDQVAALAIEVVQGEGGFNQAPKSFVKHLRSLCDLHGICLIADEVQSGFGRTGKFFAIEHYDVEPDLLLVGKALGTGVPLSGLVGKETVLAAAPPGGLAGTFAGNPDSCAAALAVIRIIERDGLLARAAAIGTRLTNHIHGLRHREDMMPIGDVRGLGAMVAFDLVTARGGNVPDPEATRLLAAGACDQGVLLLPCGYYGNTIRLSVPLTITDEKLDEGVARLATAMALAVPGALRQGSKPPPHSLTGPLILRA